MNELRDEVRDRYAAAAKVVATGRAADDNGADITSCCEGCAPEDGLGVTLYDPTTRAGLPEEAVLASMGCGNPTSWPSSGRARPCSTSAPAAASTCCSPPARVGPTGRAYGLDMTDEMLELARANALKAGAENVEFLPGLHRGDAAARCQRRRGHLELRDQPVDRQARVVDEMFRVLRPGGRLGISDVVADDHLSPAERAERGSYVGCIAGALSFAEYRAELVRAGFVDVEVDADPRTHRRHARRDRAWRQAGVVIRRSVDPRLAGPRLPTFTRRSSDRHVAAARWDYVRIDRLGGREAEGAWTKARRRC